MTLTQGQAKYGIRYQKVEIVLRITPCKSVAWNRDQIKNVAYTILKVFLNMIMAVEVKGRRG